MSSITQKILVVDLSIGCLGTSVTDADATNEVIEEKAASRDAGRFAKNLLKEPLAPIKQVMGEARRLHRDFTLPGLSRGLNLLPIALQEKYHEAMDRKREAYFAAVAEFKANYVAHIDADRLKLGALFRPADYPAVELLDKYFKFDFAIFDMPQGDFARLDGIYAARLEQMKASYDAKLKEIGDRAANEVRRQLADLIGKVAERLADPDAKIYDTLLQNLRDYLALVPDLNITNDPLVEQVRAEAASKLDISTEILRKSAFAREQTAGAARQIVERFGAAGVRKFAA